MNGPATGTMMAGNEIDAIFIDAGSGGQMEAVFAADVAASKTIDLQQ